MKNITLFTILATILGFSTFAHSADKQCKSLLLNIGHYQSMAEDNTRLRDLQDPVQYAQAIFDRYPVKAIENFSRFYRWKTRMKARATTWLVSGNDEPYAQYYMNGRRAETIQVIDHIIWKSIDSEEWNSAYQAVMTWIETYKNYRSRIQATVDEGFTAMRRIPKLEPYYKGKKAWTMDSWPKEGFTMKLPVYENGEYSESDRHWDRYEDFRRYFREQQAAIVRTFSLNKIDEKFRKSEVFSELLEQADLHSQLIYLRGELKKKNRNRIKDYHEVILLDVEEALKDDALTPRDDAVRHRQDLEFKDEWRHFLKSFSLFKRSSYAEKLGLSDRTSEALKSNGWLSRTVTTLKPFIWVGLASSALATGKFLLIETGLVGKAVATVSRSIDDTSRSMFGATAKERTCAMSERDFSFWTCYGGLATQFLGPELVISRDDPNYDLRSQEIAMKLELYEQHMINLRKQMKNAELFAIAVNSLNNNGFPNEALKAAAESYIVRNKLITENMDGLVIEVAEALINEEARITFETKYGVTNMNSYARVISEMGDELATHYRNNFNLEPLEAAWDSMTSTPSEYPQAK